MNTAVSNTADERLQRFLGFLQADPENVSLQVDVFEMAMSQAAFDVAQERVDHALQQMPGDPFWTHRLANLCIAQKRYPDAEALLAGLEQHGYTDPGIRFNRAYIAFCEARYEQACTILISLLQGDTVIPDAMPLLLRTMHRQGQLKEALHIFESMMNMPAVNNAAFGIASLIALDASRMTEAKLWSERALKTEFSQLEALVARGSCALAEQDAPGAIEYLRRALNVNDKDGRTWSALGLALMLHMQLAAALQHFQIAVTYMPDHIGTWHAMAWCQLMLKDMGAAQTSFEHALALDRNFGESHGGLAVSFAMQGRTHDAQEHIDRALKLDPQNVSARYAQAILSGEANDPERFSKLVERILKGRTTLAGNSMMDTILRRLS